MAALRSQAQAGASSPGYDQHGTGSGGAGGASDPGEGASHGNGGPSSNPTKFLIEVKRNEEQDKITQIATGANNTQMKPHRL